MANFLSNIISLLLGNSNGTFTAASERNDLLAAGIGLIEIEATDIEGDGDADLIVTNLISQEVSVLRNLLIQRGFGFEPPENFGVAQFAVSDQFSLATATFDNSGTVDLAVANSTVDNVRVLLNTLIGGAHRVELDGVAMLTGLDFVFPAPLVVKQRNYFNSRFW